MEDPVYDPNCPHYECKKCLYQYFDFHKSKRLPCPQCRTIINKDHLIELPLAKSIKDIINESHNNELLNYNENENEKCSKHTYNEVFYLCLDCKLKMYPVCDEERKKHEQKNHHIVNYKRFIKLFYIIKNNFEPLKKFISEKQKNVNEYKNIIALMAQQKKTYLDLFNEFSKNIENLYKENQDKINKIIADIIHIIANLTNFMNNIKIRISVQIKKKYNDFDNLKEIDEEIKNRISKLKLKNLDENNILELKNQVQNKIVSFDNQYYNFNFNKNDLLQGGNLGFSFGGDIKYNFGVCLSQDKQYVIPFLDINKIHNNLINNSAYGVFIEYGKMKKKLYLEKLDKDSYYYENYIPFEELFENENNIEIKLTIIYLGLI